MPQWHTVGVADSGQTEELIAQRLSDARRGKGWTLTKAAATVGLSVTHLSRLEKAERQPSIGVLIQLARSYGLSLGELVGEEPQPTCHVFRSSDAAIHEGPDGTYAAVSGISGHNLLDAIRLELPGSARTSRAAQHPGEEWLFVQTGRVRLRVAARTVDLEPGDAAHFDAQSPHRLQNLGRSAAKVFIVSVSPQVGPGNGHR